MPLMIARNTSVSRDFIDVGSTVLYIPAPWPFSPFSNSSSRRKFLGTLAMVALWFLNVSLGVFYGGGGCSQGNLGSKQMLEGQQIVSSFLVAIGQRRHCGRCGSTTHVTQSLYRLASNQSYRITHSPCRGILRLGDTPSPNKDTLSCILSVSV